MSEPSIHINYTFEDIQRYLQREMSAAEMHAIEKAALQDPFLADAIEGYNEADFTITKQHLNEINTTLSGKKEKTKVVAFKNRTRWLSVAALVIIIVGITALSMYLLRNLNNNQQLAQLKNEPVRNETSNDSATNNINVLPEKNDTAKSIAADKNFVKPLLSSSLSLKKRNKTIPVKATESKETTAVASITAAAPQQYKDEVNSLSNPLNKDEDSVPKIITKRISGVNIEPTTFAGKVMDEKNQPVANAIVESADKTITVLTNNKGDFSLFKSDTILAATASNIGYITNNSLLKPGNNNVITLKQNNSALNDVVVVGYGSLKKNKETNSGPQPVGGWQSFNNYVIKKLNIDSAKANYVNSNDLVEIEFLINRDGLPHNFKILKPLDDEKNSKAIEILKSGPKWMNTSKNKKAKVTIHFSQP